ncbi:MAG: tetratricopeptide repeat protein, partial [Deltaproteobacteria bacterium]|nr:tetratricopeptide repeat protein [Deltaproteobacteria bacterium]
YLKVIHYQDDNRFVHLRLGFLYYDLKNIAKATEHFQKAYDQGANNHQIIYYLGLLYGMQEDYKKAVELFEEIPIDNSPIATELIPSLASAYYQLGKEGKVKALLKKAVELYPNEEKIWEVRGSFYANQKDYEKGLEVIEEGLQYFPHNSNLQLHESILLDKLGRTDEALEKIQNLLKREPNNASALNFWGYTYLERGEQINQATEALEKAYQLDPESAYIIDSLGWAYFKQGKTQEALKLMLKANQDAPEEPIIQEHLAEIYLALGQLENAKEYFKKAYTNIKKIKKPSYRDKVDQARIKQRYLETKKL